MLDLDGGSAEYIRFKPSVNDWYVDDNEIVFRILNGYYIDEETGHDDVFDAHVSGYRLREGVRKDGTEYKFRDMHSLSVGDIIVDDSPDGDSKAYIVDSFGFKQIQFCLLYTLTLPTSDLV